MDLQTHKTCKGMATPPPDLAAPLPGMPSPPGLPPAPPGDAVGNESYEIEGMLSRCVYMHSPLPNTEFFNHSTFAKDSKCDKDFIPDLRSILPAAWKYC
jgi:hypothetical protein